MNDLPNSGDRVTGRCRSLNTLHTIIVSKVTKDSWPGASGYTIHRVGVDNGRTYLMGAETIIEIRRAN